MEQQLFRPIRQRLHSTIHSVILCDNTPMNGMEYIQSLIDGKTKTSPIAQQLTLAIKHFTPNHVTMTAVPCTELSSSRGVLLGGISSLLIDYAMSMAVVSSLDDNIGTFTLEMKVNFIKAITLSYKTIEIHGQVIHAGRTIAHTEATIQDQHNNTLAKGTGTFIILPDQSIDNIAKQKTKRV